ncbi:hypothetical protein RIF29_34907 [Crotalaria pallida]|uniref:Uncharacterized protein n=1 Tax=Crotalaria pallida TaxID=3830 RepID=A0AAN9HTS0_CROPI
MWKGLGRWLEERVGKVGFLVYLKVGSPGFDSKRHYLVDLVSFPYPLDSVPVPLSVEFDIIIITRVFINGITKRSDPHVSDPDNSNLELSVPSFNPKLGHLSQVKPKSQQPKQASHKLASQQIKQALHRPTPCQTKLQPEKVLALAKSSPQGILNSSCLTGSDKELLKQKEEEVLRIMNLKQKEVTKAYEEGRSSSEFMNQFVHKPSDEVMDFVNRLRAKGVTSRVLQSEPPDPVECSGSKCGLRQVLFV